jgi:hypothetical protein
MNDHAMKAAPRKTGVIILGGGEGACHSGVCTCRLGLCSVLSCGALLMTLSLIILSNAAYWSSRPRLYVQPLSCPCPCLNPPRGAQAPHLQCQPDAEWR